MGSIRIDVYDRSEYDIWFAAAPYTASAKPAKTLKAWAQEQGADITYNLAWFNMVGKGNDQYGVIKGRTLQDLRCNGVMCGYGGTAERLTLDSGNYVSGVKVAIKDCVVQKGLTTSRVNACSRNMCGMLADGRYIHVQSSDGCTEDEVARYVNGKYTVALLLVQDAGGSTGMYRAADGYLFAPEREGTNGRPVCSVVCIKAKNKKQEGNKVSKKVFIGVGHGGSDPGASANGLVEKTVNLTMAQALRDELVRHGVEVKMSREKDENDTVAQEVDECNAYGPDLAVEVHNNAGGGKGFEAYIYPGSATGRKMAENIEAEVKAIGQTSRGVKTSTGFMWVRSTKAPSVLLEGFFVDGADYTKFDTVAEQRAMGVAYAKGVLKTLGIAYITPAEEGAAVEKLQDAMEKVQKAAGLDNDTMGYLLAYEYGAEMIYKLAAAVK